MLSGNAEDVIAGLNFIQAVMERMEQYLGEGMSEEEAMDRAFKEVEASEAARKAIINGHQ